jgi:transposase-like protein
METLRVIKESPNTLVKMKRGPGRPRKSEAIIKDVKRRTKRQFNPEEKIAIVIEGMSGEESIAALCRREGIAQSVYYSWSKAFMEAGKARLNGDTKREADSDEVNAMRKENAELKEALAEETLRVRFLKKLSKGMG